MPLSRLENFLKNAEGNILYVNPSDFDATDSVENRGNSLTRPFRTIQRALIESARFSYQVGKNNDLVDRTTILVYPGIHYIDNRPGFSIQEVTGAAVFKRYFNGSWTTSGATINEFTLNSNFDIFDETNDLRKFNSVNGGCILPRGTSVVGLELRKTKIRPLYVPDPLNDSITPSAVFRTTGTCYFTAFTIFDADPQRACYKDSTIRKVAPNFSHHKLTCFEFADGVNKVVLDGNDTGVTDLEMYYYKLTHAYGTTSGRGIANFPATGGTDFEPSIDEFRITGDVQPNPLGITSVFSGDGVIPTSSITITTNINHGLYKDTPVLITGITTNPVSYTGSFLVSDVISPTRFTYNAPETPTNPSPGFNDTLNATVKVESDSVASASPYIFNCSLRSVFGMNGILGDGSKATGFKSMVTAQFTGISLQKDENAFILYDPATNIYNDILTVAASQKPLHTNSRAIYRPGWEGFHMKVTNDSLFQCVSIFAIGFARHFVAESGGDMSITNSNSNFGAVSLESVGFREESFNRDDVGYITHIIPPREPALRISNVTWASLDATKIVSAATTSRLYIAGYPKSDIPPSTQVDSYKIGAKQGELLSLAIVIGTQQNNFSAPILMTVPSGIGTSSQKVYEVNRPGGINAISNNTLTFSTNHQLFNGETIRVLTDNGEMPTNILSGKVYFAITTGLNANQIKLAASLNDATSGSPISGISNKGGLLNVISTVADKRPGEPGHPVQYDTDQSNWYVQSTPVTAFNTIYDGIVGIGTSIIGNVTGATFVTRRVDNRGLNERVYKLRYVIPKEFGNARGPSDGFTLQESKSVGVGSASFLTSTLANSTQLRNPKIIKGAGWSGDVVTVGTELPHKLVPKDIVKISKITSSNNTTAADDFGFNGDFEVISVTSPKTFTYRLTTDPGTFQNLVNQRTTQQQVDALPTVQRKKYKDSVYIYRSQEIKKLIPGSDGQDGIYHITPLCGSIPVNADVGYGLSYKKFNQDVRNLFPQQDRDNYQSDPQPTISFAELSPLGKVSTNERRNSVTRESLNYFIQNNRIGYAVTGVTISGTGNTTLTLFTEIDHNFNSIKSVTLTNPGAGYNNNAGITTTIYSAELINASIDGKHATAKVIVSAANTISSVEIVDFGSAYGVGNTMTISPSPAGNPTTFAVVEVTEVNSHVGSSLDMNGFADPLYNGTFKILSVPTARTVVIENSLGIAAGYRARNDARFPVMFLGSPGIKVQSFVFTPVSGVATVTSTSSHGLIPGNTFTVVGSGHTYFERSFAVSETIGVTTFTFNAGITTSTPTISNVLTVSLHKSGLSANATAIGFGEESLGGRGQYIYAGITTTASTLVVKTDQTIALTSSSGFAKGDYCVIDSEVIRLSSTPTAGVFSVNRGQFATVAADHPLNSLVKKITVIPVELRRHSILRASSHTFEYLGYGPGNYSTGLPINQDRILSNDEILVSQSIEQDGGAVVYTGMNDRGEFFNGTSKVNAQTGEEEILDAPIVTYFGEEDESEIQGRNSGVFDDLVVRERITVEGGENQNQTSQFYGPVNFSEKVVSTADAGLETRDLYIKGVASQAKLFTVGISTPINIPKIGDISYISAPDPGGFIGHVYADNDWRRWGIISKDKNRDFLVIDQLGVGQSTGIYNFSDAAEVNGTLKVKNLYVGGAVTFAGAQAIGNAFFDVININSQINLVGSGATYTILSPNANSIVQFQNAEFTGTGVTFTNARVTLENSFNSTFNGISTVAGTLRVGNLELLGGEVNSTNGYFSTLRSNVGVFTSAYINAGIVTTILAEYVGGISPQKPLRLHVNTGFITSLTGTAATITTLSGTTGTIQIFRASDNLFTPLLQAVTGIVTTLRGDPSGTGIDPAGAGQLIYNRSRVALSTATNMVVTDWVGSPVAYINAGFTTTAIVSGWIGAPTAYINSGIVTTISGTSATYTNVQATTNLVSNDKLFSPVGVVTIMSGTQASYTGIVTASQLKSTIAIGAAPLIVASNTLVSNLNAELLQGSAPSVAASANTIVKRNSNGLIEGGTSGNAETSTLATNVVGVSGRVLYNNGTNTTTTSANLTFNGSNLVCGGTVAANSDERLKENVITIENALEKVLSLRGVEYDRIDSGDHQIGVIAQEVEKVVPAVVYGDEIKSVAYGNLVGLLIEAIKDLKGEISELKEKVAKLEDSK